MKNNSPHLLTDASSLPHDSAIKHVTGQSVYVDDMPVNAQLLHGHVVFSKIAHGLIEEVDISKALKLEGVEAIMLAKDIPGENQMGPVIHDEACIAEKEIMCMGQAIALIAARDEATAHAAEALIEWKIKALEAILTIDQAIAKQSRIADQRRIERGEVDKAMASATHRISGKLITGAQEHWYLETQACLAIPREGKEMLCYSSTQHPSETQAIVAEVLGIQRHLVEVDVKRLGGAFGGKETSGNHLAAWASLLAQRTRRPVKIRLNRDEDQSTTGKRHPFESTYEIGFDDQGVITAYSVILNSNAGHAADLSMAILERAMLHAENAYFIPNIRIIGNAWRTNLPSNVAFRGFGAPQGIAVIENAIDRIARMLGIDPQIVRERNYYGTQDRNSCPYGELVENNRLQLLTEKLQDSSDYHRRRKEVDEFNQTSEFVKRGISMIPVKFGISFTTAFLNQAGALVHIYADGSVQVNHGGIEMGQGLNSKMLAIASAELGINPESIIVTATNTSKIPNTSATAASSGSDLNGMAVKNAIDILKARLMPVAVEMLKEQFQQTSAIENIVLAQSEVYDKQQAANKIAFAALCGKAYIQQVSLSSTGFYKTPDIWFDRAKGIGRPFHYYSFGMAVSEVEVDILTGHTKVLRSDIVQDVGDSLHAEIDRGQIEGGFVQGLGWVLTEDMKWNKDGKLLNHSPDTYKIPTVRDIPADFRVELLRDVPNPNTIRKSKAIGEPPLVLAFSVWLAVKHAVSAVHNHQREPNLPIPATNENVVLSLM